MRPAVAASIVLMLPFLVAATDPIDDGARCPRVQGARGDVPDLVEATAEIVELGTSIRWTLRFSEPLQVPDGRGKPFRVDIVIFDPDVPAVDAGLYRGVNRLVRYDAVREPVTTILLLPEAGQSRFIAPTVDGDTLVAQVPGRTLTADEDETGTSPGLDRLRWGVVTRDEASCDLLGDGRPSERLRRRTPEPAVASADVDVARWPWPAAIGGAAVVAAIAAAAYVFARRRYAR